MNYAVFVEHRLFADQRVLPFCSRQYKVYLICNSFEEIALLHGKILIQNKSLMNEIASASSVSEPQTVNKVKLDMYGRLLVMTDDEVGGMCGDIDQYTADLVCKANGFE